MEINTIGDVGVTQQQIALLNAVWRRIATVNPRRTQIQVQNLAAANPVYLYAGEIPPGAAVNGTVGFKCLRGGCSPACEWISGDNHAMFRAEIWALAVGVGGASVLVGEF